MADKSGESKSKKLTITLSWKLFSIVLFVLLAGLAGYVLYERPWQNTANPRTIEMTGEALIKREPDSFVFNPSFEADSQVEITQKTNQVVADLKSLGLGDAGIQTQVSNYEDYGVNGPTGKTIYSLYLTLAVEDKDLAQKVQDYLVDANAVGQITPTTSFKKETQKQLKDEATAQAVEDAKRRAEQTAENLDVRIVKVLSINEPEQFDIYPIASYDSSVALEGESLPINAGQSEFPYSVKVVFEIK